MVNTPKGGHPVAPTPHGLPQGGPHVGFGESPVHKNPPAQPPPAGKQHLFTDPVTSPLPDPGGTRPMP